MLNYFFAPARTEFDYQDHQIRLELWPVTGLERVYLDDQLVSEQRNFSSKRSEHRFSLGQQQARLQLLPRGIAGVMFGHYDIRLQLSRQTVASDELCLFNGTALRHSLYYLLAAVALGAAAGSLTMQIIRAGGAG